MSVPGPTLPPIARVLKTFSKGKFALEQAVKAQRGSRMYGSNISLTSELDEGGLSTPRLGRSTPGNGQVSIVQKAG